MTLPSDDTSKASSSTPATDSQNQGTNSPQETKTQGKRGKYLIEIERNKCISVGNCVAIAGDIFELDAEQIAIMRDPSIPLTSDDEAILMAARSCPTQAIIIKDSETGQQIFP